MSRKEQIDNLKSFILRAEIRRDNFCQLMKKEKVSSDNWGKYYTSYSELTTKISIWNRQLDYLTKGHSRLGEPISFIKVSKQN